MCVCVCGGVCTRRGDDKKSAGFPPTRTPVSHLRSERPGFGEEVTPHLLNLLCPHQRCIYHTLKLNKTQVPVQARRRPCCYSGTKSCLTLCDLMDFTMPGFPVLHPLPEFAQTPVHGVSDAIQPSHPLWPPSPPSCLQSFPA